MICLEASEAELTELDAVDEDDYKCALDTKLQELSAEQWYDFITEGTFYICKKQLTKQGGILWD